MHKAIILGSGPDSLNAAYIALGRNIQPVILEPTGSMFGHPPCKEVYLNQLVRAVYFLRDEICSLHVIDGITGELNLFSGDYFYFPGPLHTLVTAMSHVPDYRFLPDRKFKNLLDDLAPSTLTYSENGIAGLVK